MNFGEALESSSFRWQVPLRNTSSRPLDVRMEKSCDCAGVEPEKLKLAPGEARQIIVKLDLLHNRSRYAGRPTRPFVAHLTAVHGAREQLPLIITGTVRAILDMWPPNLHLKEDLVEGQDGAEVSVRIKPVVPLSWMIVKESPPNLQVRLDRDTEGYLLHVRPKAGLPRGFFQQQIALQMADGKEAVLPEQTLAVTGTVTGRFVTTPAETMFGFRDMGATAEETVQLHARRREPFAVVKVTANDPDTRVEALQQDGREWSF